MKKKDGVHLPGPVSEDDYPAGDGPAWVSKAIGAPASGALANVVRFLTDDSEETALVLRFANGKEQVFRPARLVTTRRLSETLGALGFPVPYYQPPQLARIGQALGRIADRAAEQDEHSVADDYASVVADWAASCLRSKIAYLLVGRAGQDVRAAIEHVHSGDMAGDLSVPLIVEPERVAGTARGVALAWTVAVRGAVRERLGTVSDGDLNLQLKRAGLVRERLAARPGPGEKRTFEMPCWVVYNGWRGLELPIPDGDRVCGPIPPTPLESVVHPLDARAPTGAHTRITNERSTTPNGPEGGFS